MKTGPKVKEYKKMEDVGEHGIKFHSYIGEIDNGVRNNFICHCGNKFEGKVSAIKSGGCKSCGCMTGYWKGMANYKHGFLRRGKENVYARRHKGIMDRCYKKECKNYEGYGGRGIILCEEWHDVTTFVNYMEKTFGIPEEGYTIDRIDVNGNYEPGNIRLADAKTQAGNTRSNVYVEVEGERMILSDVAEKYGIRHNTLSYRYNDMGLRGDDLIKDQRSKEIMFKGEMCKLSDISKKYKIDYTTLAGRYKKGLKDDDLIKHTAPLKVNIFGEDLTLTEISNKHNIPRGTIQERYSRGKDIESLITERNK